jgi:hypothetical protein
VLSLFIVFGYIHLVKYFSKYYFNSNSFNIFIDALTCGRTDVPVNTLIDVLRSGARDFRSRERSRNISS